MQIRKPLSSISVALTLIAIAFACFQFYYYSNFIVDDAYISFRYAEHFANGNGLVFNKNEFVEGYTNFLWVLLLGCLKKIGIDVRLSSLLLGTIFSISTLLSSAFLSRLITIKYRMSYPQRFLPPYLTTFGVLAVATSPSFGIWTVAGLETSLFMCLLTISIYLHLYEKTRTYSFPLSALCFGMLTLTRPEGLLYFGLTISYNLFHRLYNHESRAERSWKTLLVFLIPVVPHVLWRWLYYESLLPNTYYMKVGREFQLSGIKYAYEFFLTYGGVSIFLVSCFFLIIYRIRDYWVGYFLLFFGVSTFYFAYVGGDWMPQFRFFVPLLPIYFLILQEGIREIFLQFFQKHLWKAIIGIICITAMILLNNFYHLYKIQRIDSRFDGHIEIGKFLQKHASPDDSLAAIDIGAMAYFSRLRTIDYFGLVDKHIARLEPQTYTFEPGFWGHKSIKIKSDTEYVLSQKPTFIELNTKNNPATMEQTLPSDPYSELMLRSSKFRRNYRPLYYAGGTTLFIRKEKEKN